MTDKIQNNDKMTSNGTSVKLSNTELRRLLKLSKKGDQEAKNKILLANMGLILSIAQEIKNPKADMDDLVADGCIRFLEIIDDYNPDVSSLSTYLWIRLRQFMAENVVDYKHGLSRFIGAYKETEAYLFDVMGRQPSRSEISSYMGVSEKVLKNRLNELSERSRISLDTPVDFCDGEASTLSDTAMCATLYDASTEILRRDEEEVELEAWNRLSGDERDLLALRNFQKGKKISLREASAICGLSTETIRQREKEAKNHFRTILEEYGITVA